MRFTRAIASVLLLCMMTKSVLQRVAVCCSVLQFLVFFLEVLLHSGDCVRAVVVYDD